MAAKKKAVTKRKKKSTAMVDYKERYRQMAEEQSEKLPSGTATLSIKGGSFTYQGADLGEELDCIILDFGYENSWYDRPYNPDDMGPPACYAIAQSNKNMEPEDDSPVRQCEDCNNCDLNQWGSAGSGRGKACGNHRRLAIMSVTDIENDPENIEVVMLRTPPTSNSNFDKYAKGVSKVRKVPLCGVVTRISFDPDEDWEKLIFTATDMVDEDHIGKVMEKVDEAQEMIMEKYDVSGYEKPTPTKRKGRTAPKKKAGAKKKRGKSKFSK